MDSLRDIFFEYSPWILFLPLFLSLKNYRRYPAEFKTITYYLLVAATTQVISFALWKAKKNNLPVLHIYTTAEYLTLLVFYYFILKDFLSAILFYILAVIFPLFAIADSFFIENIHAFNKYSRSIEAVIFIFLAMCWFIKIVSKATSGGSSRNDIKYINSGFLIYFGGSIILFSFRNFITEMALNMRLNIWSIHTLLAVILYVLITIGLWKHQKV